MNERPGHGLDEYLALLDKLPRQVNVTLVGGTGNGNTPSDVEFDRRVRRALDRMHRRAHIAEN